MYSITLCASKRHADHVAKFAADLRGLGYMVFEPNFSEPIPEETAFATEHVKSMVFKGITLEHFEWIRKSDLCYILNVEDYCGVSVSLEMGFAYALGKIIVAQSHQTGDPCRDALIDFVAQTPVELQNLISEAPSRQILR